MDRRAAGILFASIACCSVGLTATFAADAPVTASIASSTVYNWSGIYFGVHTGYGGGMDDWSTGSEIAPTMTPSIRLNGYFAGGQLGINQQSGNVVFGLEVDGAWADFEGSQTLRLGPLPNGIAFFGDQSTKIGALVTVAGRFGFAADHWLVYAKAGAAWARVANRLATGAVHPPNVVTVSASGREARIGHLLGFGAEYALVGSWSAKLEYNYVNFGTQTATLRSDTSAAVLPIPRNFQFDQSLHLIKFGLNYRIGTRSILMPETPEAAAPGFNWTGPYIGAQGGYGFGRQAWETVPRNSFGVDGGLVGVAAGVNVQVSRFVFGAEGEWMWSGIIGEARLRESFGAGFTGSTSHATRINWLAAASLRVGAALTNRVLGYAKFGMAVLDERHDLNFTQTGPQFEDASVSGSRLHTGLLIGVGTEYAFAGNWSVKAEYNYIHFAPQRWAASGTRAVDFPPLTTFDIVADVIIRQDLHLFKFGMNYRFNAPAALSARF